MDGTDGCETGRVPAKYPQNSSPAAPNAPTLTSSPHLSPRNDRKLSPLSTPSHHHQPPTTHHPPLNYFHYWRRRACFKALLLNFSTATRQIKPNICIYFIGKHRSTHTRTPTVYSIHTSPRAGRDPASTLYIQYTYISPRIRQHSTHSVIRPSRPFSVTVASRIFQPGHSLPCEVDASSERNSAV